MLTEKELEEIRRKMLELEEEPPVGSWKSIQAEVKPKQDWSWLKWLLPLLLLVGIGTHQLKQTEPSGSQVEQSAHATTKTQDAAMIPVPDSQPGEQQNQNKAEAKLPTEQPGQQNSTRLPASVSVAKATLPAPSGIAHRPEAEAIPFLSSNTPHITTWADSAERNHRYLAKKRLAPVALQLPVAAKRKRVDHETATGIAKVLAGEAATSEKEGAEVNAEEEKPEKAAIPEKKLDEQPKPAKPAPQEKQQASRNEWTAGVYFAPRYAFRKFLPNATDDVLITKVSSANQLDPERMGFEFGANYSRVLTPRLFGEAGLSWMQLKENVAYTLTTGELENTNVRESGSGQIVVESTLKTEERQLISSYAYAGLRLGTTYYFMERGKSRLNITVGGGANLLVKGRTQRYSNGVWTETVEFPSVENILEQSNYNLQLGVGYNSTMLENYEVTLMPAINYFLGSTFKEREPLGLKPYSLGLTLQLKKRFNR
ncbi:hypothetical protein I0P70_02580 [Pontibacter sp. FD36]|uniref:hypothetical protein n=1 Tax=Pontibacter sp. FD36 TaxID=2789860 RepID=UPI0018A9411C|nr:hypothetical protein [Pontibacter sp. FD36]MBF8962119.1 hypothetical protein [Pontibacter sp. FD36]